MTGAAHGPERGSPEYRTADHRERHRTPRQALRSLHAAESDLLGAQRRDAIARAVAALTAEHAQTGTARRKALSTHYQAKIDALSPSLSASERAAAIARLRGEEQDALAALEAEQKATVTAARTKIAGDIKIAFRARRRTLARHQRHQRATLALTFRAVASGGKRRRSRSAIRKLADRLWIKRTGRQPPRAPK